MNVALIGCGKISQAHIKALQGVADVTITCVCDRDAYLAEKVAAKVGARAYSDLTEMLEREKIDAVHIMTPPATHADIAVQAMEAGCHALVEKPMTLSVADADRMIAAAEANGVKLSANHNYLFKPSVAKARELVAGGEIGRVVYVDSYYGLSAEGGQYAGGGGRHHWAWDLPGGPFSNFLPHLSYIQLAFLGDVEAVAGVTLGHADGPDSPATELAVMLKGSSAPGVMNFSMRGKPYAKFVDVYGTDGIVHADLVREVCTVNRNMRLPRMLSKVAFNLEDSTQLLGGTVVNTAGVLFGTLKNMPGLHMLIEQFYASIREDTEPPVTGEDGRKVAAIMEGTWSQSPELADYAASAPPVTITSEPQTDAERRAMPVLTGKRVLVTGATGFLGSRLVPALHRAGADVVALVRGPGSVSQMIAEQAELVGGDLREGDAVDAAMKDVDIVVHCAAITTNQATWDEHEAVNVEGTGAILEAACRAGVERVVHVSSVVVYGLKNGDVSEASPYPANPDPWAHYMRSKIGAEELAASYNDEKGLPVTVVRLGVLYGPGGGRPPGRGLMQIGGMSLLIGSGRNHMPYTYVDNAVDALLLAASTPEAAGETYNIVDEPQVRLRDAARQAAELKGERVMLVPIPAVVLNTGARVLESRSKAKGAATPPKLSRYVIRSAARNIRYSTEKARKELGWEPAVGLEEGLRRTLDAS